MITTTPGPLTPWPAVMCDCQVVIGLLLSPEMKSNKQLQQPDQVKLGSASVCAIGLLYVV
jgi:hypothetical protein